MRKFVYSIGLLFVCAFLICGFYYSYQNQDYRLDSLENAIETEHMIMPEFHIRIHQNKVIVCLQNGSVYETTDIVWDDLPKEIQDRIKNGFVLYSTQELYNFLESYSS